VPSSVILARDHLEQAVAILSVEDERTSQLRNILMRTIALMDDITRKPEIEPGIVIDLARHRRRREG
jgi:hypothetical protein